MSKLAEKLTILLEHGQSLLFNLWFLTHRKETLFFQPIYAKINKVFSKNYPDIPSVSKIKEYEKLIKFKKTQLNDDVLPWFEVLEKASLFVPKGVKVLNEGEAYIRKVGSSGSLIRNDYFSLLVMISRVCYLLRDVPDVKVVLSYYVRVGEECGEGRDSTGTSVFKFFQKWERPVEQLREALRNIHQTIGKAVIDVGKVWDSTDQEPKEGKLLKWQELEVFKSPETIEKQDTEITLGKFIERTNVAEYILFTFLILPEALCAGEDTANGKKVGKKKTLGTMLLSRVLPKYYSIGIFGDVVVDIHGEYDLLFAKYKSPFKGVKMGRLKKHIDKSSPPKSFLYHKMRRQFLNVQLKNIYRAVHDSPYLAGPKFPLVLALLALAQGELKWFIWHKEVLKVFPKKCTYAMKVADVREIVFYSDQLIQTCRLYEDVIREHYKHMLRNDDSIQMDLNAISSKLDPMATEAIDYIENEYQTNEANLEGGRLTWKRLMVYCMNSLKLRELDVRKFFPEGAKLYFFSEHIDKIRHSLVKHSMKCLYFHKAVFEEMFKFSLRGEMYFCIPLIRLHDMYRENIHSLDSEMKEKAGFKSTIPAEKLMIKMKDYILKILQEYMGPKGYHLLFRRIQSTDPDNPGMLRPGAESHFRHARVIKPLAERERILSMCLGVMNQNKEIQVFDTVFYPLEMLKTGIENLAERFIERLVNVDALRGGDPDAVFTPPSKIVNRINVLVSCLSMMDEYIYINPREVVLSALVNKFIPLGAGKENIINLLSRFYVSRIVKRAREHNLLYHPIRHTFINTKLTSRTLEIVAEHYLDQNELVSLVNLVGPFGIQIIDKRLLGQAFSIVEAMKKELIEKYKDRYAEYEDNLFEDDLFRVLNDKKLEYPSMDRFFDMCVDLGALLQFRLNVRSALKRSMKTCAPQIFNVVKDVREQCDSAIKKLPIFKQINHLAVDCGIFEGEDSFKEKIEQLSGDVWKCLPVAFASMLTSKRFLECSYNTELEGWLNNAHLVILAYRELHHSLFDDVEIYELSKRFATAAGLTLLNMRQSKQFEKQTSNCYVFIDKLITSTKFLKMSLFEKVNPHILVRNAYVEFFDKKKSKKEVPGQAAPGAK